MTRTAEVDLQSHGAKSSDDLGEDLLAAIKCKGKGLQLDS
jgi:hypothetical protein